MNSSENNIVFRYVHKFENASTLKKEVLKHKLDSDRLIALIAKSNRAEAQTQFLFNLLDGDFNKLCELEEKIKNNFLFFCPDSKEEVNKILKMGYGSHYFKFGDIEHELFLQRKASDEALIKKIKTI